jgi:cytochrome b561
VLAENYVLGIACGRSAFKTKYWKKKRVNMRPLVWSKPQIALHWLSVLIVLGLFVLGNYMVGLDYYDPLYHRAPNWHKSVGILFLFILTFRLLLRIFGSDPGPIPTHEKWERIAASIAHIGLYLMLFIICFSGYLISTANGKPVSVFAWFDVPAIIYDLESQEDVAGLVHEWTAYVMLATAAAHALAALKHHFVDRDQTLRRMLTWRASKRQS